MQGVFTYSFSFNFSPPTLTHTPHNSHTYTHSPNSYLLHILPNHYTDTHTTLLEKEKKRERERGEKPRKRGRKRKKKRERKKKEKIRGEEEEEEMEKKKKLGIALFKLIFILYVSPLSYFCFRVL